MKKFYLSFSLLLISSMMFAQSIDRLFRFPTTNGKQIVFTYAGDLYSVPMAGGEAHRLTSDVGYEMFAHFSPTGDTLAFTAQYDGNTEVYKMSADGSAPIRLTYTATLHRDDVADRMGPNNIVMTWTPDGKEIVYRSRKQSFNSFVGSLFKVSNLGGMSEELPLPSGGFCSYNADASKLAYNRVFREFRTWKYYKGGMADDIWIYDFATKKVENITNNVAQDIIPMWHGNQIFFISDRDRIMNLFSYNLETKELMKMTQFKEYDIKFPTIHGDYIVFGNGGYIYSYHITDQKLTKVEISIKNDFLGGRKQWVDASKNMSNYSASPAGERIAVTAHGEVFNLPVKHGITYNLTKSSGAHDRNAEWSPDGKYIAYISDKTGEYEIYIQKPDLSEEAIQLTDKDATYKFSLQWSPDSKKILWSDKKMNLYYVDIATKNITKVAHSKNWEIRDYNWSPDSRWITFSDNDGKGMDKIFVYSLDTKKTEAVTMGWYDASNPVFSDNGKYLFFASSRIFNPTYSATEWNHSYSNMNKIYFVTLQEDTPSPFAFKNDELKTAEANESKDKKTESSSESKNISIDFENIQDRVIDLPIAASNYWNIDVAGDVVYYSQWTQGGQGQHFKMYNLKTQKETDLGKGIGFGITSNRKKMIVMQGRKFQIIELPKGPVKFSKPIATADMKIWIDKHAEWKQIYDEAWRQMRDFFYDPNMHGVDWKAMHDKYAVLVPYVNHRNDLTYLIGELIGELNIGHAYSGAGARPKVERIYTGLLGAKLSKDASGYFKIDEILDGENFRSNLRSPLKEVGLDVKEGDFIVAINGVSTKNMEDIFTALVGQASQLVELKVNSSASESGAKTIVVKPIADEAKLYYYNWVQHNIDVVSKATDGQVGYIHVPDMGRDGLNEFIKHFYPQLNKKALIIDDRGNGGGNVSPMLIERLRREITRANILRNQELQTQTPTKMMIGPMVLLINNYSASDGDLFPYSFRKHKLGKIIGVRSWGGVVGIRGSLPFIDGGSMTRPEFASYSADGKEWIIEGHGVDPDIVVDNDPAREYAGVDDQLNRAIEEILKDLKNYQPVPPPPPYPDKSK
jgi:tricorn protease